ncbi:DUF421 domain-containing protein [Dactylosporangium aurantiacum]|uniref:DUF421 domain-containing protein n=1 Tax=Dactylosporangium aurantiacum TaxID=35754 RepID=A0A9Q9IRR1_9ACTN|nr:YetF domain-containing protein [Dactylosporangium aurantiacum]MDG6110409.1 DUF421 domain-containing protein [Dactylosporangium aurantiacum]UWZ58582.1 DUF421 domain-containing protein [Dactylosporangium aurantiacum]
MFLQSWSDLLRVAVVGVVVYPGLILVLRLSGKRMLAKMNAFDLIVTVALGSTLATILVSKDVSLAERMAALVLLVVLQLAATWLSMRSRRIRVVLKSEPTLLLRDRRLLDDAFRSQRVTDGEVRQAIRSQGSGGMEQVAAVVLETDGTLSVIQEGQADRLTALRGVAGAAVPLER